MLRKLLRSVRRHLREIRIQGLRQLGLTNKVPRDTGLAEEGDFWDRALADGGRNWVVAEYQERTDPNLELQDELKKLIPAGPGAVVEILDVGSGPLTRVGRKWAGREVRIIATDPLADHYRAMIQRHKVPAPVPVMAAQGERLTGVFSPDRFDLAYASNALDHSDDPLEAISQMLAVVKPLHYVYLWHLANEGIHQSYSGLHQWNFDIVSDDFIISDGRTTRSLREQLGKAAEIICEETQLSDNRVVIVKLQKRTK
jgi:SAM-dependent methyltransferase